MRNSVTWYKERRTQLRDFTRFGRTAIRSGDIDPQFPILRELYAARNLDDNTALWFTSVYLVFYNLGSATSAWGKYPTPDIIDATTWSSDLPYTKQRRCFRGNNGGLRQLNALVEASDGDLLAWVTNLVGNGGEEGWTRVRSGASELPYHGPWSSYKFCDMMKFVHSFPITAPDIGTKPGATAGPIAGMCSLTQLDRRQCADDINLQRDLLQYVQDEGVPANGLDQLESLLCDWQSLIMGRYYLGHDIDRDLGQLFSTHADNTYVKELMLERSKIFDKRLLGEFGGWSGMRLELNALYKKRRRIVNNFEDVEVVEMRHPSLV